MTMKYKMTFLVVCVYMLFASQAFGVSVANNPDGSFSLVGPNEDFSNWAVAGGGAADWSFYPDAWRQMITWESGGDYYSGRDIPNQWFSMSIPFNFAAPVVTARADYSCLVIPYGYNWGFCEIQVKAEGLPWTRLFYMNADDTPPPYNYTASQTPPADGGGFIGYTDFSDLVAGKTSFHLWFGGYVGDSSFTYNGGQFFYGAADREGRDFVLTGTVVPEPLSLSVLALGGIALVRRKRS
jgi:hypothetical protein